MDYLSLIYATAIAAFALAARYYSKRHSLKHIRGPPSPGFFFGHTFALTRQEEVGQLEGAWTNEYGSAWRVKECLGSDNLWFTDPKAVQHIFNKAGSSYARRKDARQIARQLMGESILHADGHNHSRIRRVMEPAFSTAQLRSFLPLFRHSAAKLSRKWREQLRSAVTEAERTVNVSRWFSRTTLDIIGEAAFDYHCGALDDDENELVHVYKNMFRDSVMHPTRATLLFRSIWPYIPDSILRFIVYIPTKEYKRLRYSLETINQLSHRLIGQKTEAGFNDSEEKKKDIMSLLVRANLSENPKTKLREAEMTAQVATFLLAGHETSAGALTWTLWELAKDKEYQSKIRSEIAAMRAQLNERSDSDPTMSDFDSLTYLNAAIKEGLRLHPLVYMLVRVANQDNVIPLSKPIVSENGNLISEITVSKGQNVTVSVWGYNRLPEVWGDDAHQWNPKRFLGLDKEKQATVGLYANLMSFGSGSKACLGWRFAVIELQSLLVDLIENFEFDIPAEKPDIQRVPAGVMIPMIRNQMRLGSQMPLKLTPLS